MILNLIFYKGCSQLFLLYVCAKLYVNPGYVYKNILIYICLIKNMEGYILYLKYEMSVKN